MNLVDKENHTDEFISGYIAGYEAAAKAASVLIPPLSIESHRPSSDEIPYKTSLFSRANDDEFLQQLEDIVDSPTAKRLDIQKYEFLLEQRCK